MIVALDEMKNYLRVDFDTYDALIDGLVVAAEKTCMDILRTDDKSVLENTPNGRVAVMYATAYLYEHREDADHHALNMTLRAMLFGSREERF